MFLLYLGPDFPIPWLSGLTQRFVILSKDRDSGRIRSPLTLCTLHRVRAVPGDPRIASSGLLGVPVNSTVPLIKSLPFLSPGHTYLTSPKLYPYRRHLVLVPTGNGFRMVWGGPSKSETYDEQNLCRPDTTVSYSNQTRLTGRHTTGIDLRDGWTWTDVTSESTG